MDSFDELYLLDDILVSITRFIVADAQPQLSSTAQLYVPYDYVSLVTISRLLYRTSKQLSAFLKLYIPVDDANPTCQPWTSPLICTATFMRMAAHNCLPLMPWKKWQQSVLNHLCNKNKTWLTDPTQIIPRGRRLGCKTLLVQLICTFREIAPHQTITVYLRSQRVANYLQELFLNTECANKIQSSDPSIENHPRKLKEIKFQSGKGLRFKTYNLNDLIIFDSSVKDGIDFEQTLNKYTSGANRPMLIYTDYDPSLGFGDVDITHLLK